MHDINQIRCPITIGRRGEKGIQSVDFDITDWMVKWPNGHIKVNFKHESDPESFYLPPNQYTVSGGMLTIYVKQNMTYKIGKAYLGVELTVGDPIKKKSAIIELIIREAMPDASGEMPEPIQNWMDGASSIVEKAEQAAGDIHLATDNIPQLIMNTFSNFTFVLEDGVLSLKINKATDET